MTDAASSTSTKLLIAGDREGCGCLYNPHTCGSATHECSCIYTGSPCLASAHHRCICHSHWDNIDTRIFDSCLADKHACLCQDIHIPLIDRCKAPEHSCICPFVVDKGKCRAIAHQCTCYSEVIDARENKCIADEHECVCGAKSKETGISDCKKHFGVLVKSVDER